MKHIKLFENFLTESISKDDFKKISAGDIILYRGFKYEVIGNDGFALDLKDDNNDVFQINYSQFKKFGNLLNPIKIILKDGDYWVKKIDSTHLMISNSKDGIDKNLAFAGHIAQYRDEPYYNDIKSWLKGGRLPHNERY